MIVLDTNVVSEALRPLPDPGVVQWLDGQAPETLFLTSVCLAELVAGIALLAKGRRRNTLEQALALQIRPLFIGRVLAFDEQAAEVFGTVLAQARAHGNNVGFADCAIAAIARAKGFVVATRNMRDFRGCGVELMNPWTEKA